MSGLVNLLNKKIVLFSQAMVRIYDYSGQAEYLYTRNAS
jgi:hypothetical protein